MIMCNKAYEKHLVAERRTKTRREQRRKNTVLRRERKVKESEERARIEDERERAESILFVSNLKKAKTYKKKK